MSFSVYSVHLPFEFYQFFFASEGSYGTPKAPTAWVKTDQDGLLFDTEIVADAKLPDGTEIKNQQRLIRFDEVNMPLEKRVRSPNPPCYLQQLTDWGNVWNFISYFNTRDFGSRIATKSQIEQGGDIKINPEQKNGCLYLSDDRTKIYLGKFEDGSLVPVVISEEKNTDLPSCVFVYTKYTDMTKIIDTRAYNSDYGPILTFVSNPSGGVPTMTMGGQTVASNYAFVRIPQLFRLSFLFNFPLVNGQFPGLESNLIQSVLKPGWSLVTLDDAKSLLGLNTMMSGYNFPNISVGVDNSGTLVQLDKTVSGSNFTLVPEDNSPGARGRADMFYLVKGTSPVSATMTVGDVLDLTKTFGELGTEDAPSSDKKKLYLILGLSLGGAILLGLILWLVLRKRN